MLLSGTIMGSAELSGKSCPGSGSEGKGLDRMDCNCAVSYFAGLCGAALDTPQFLQYSGIPAGFPCRNRADFLGAPAAWAFCRF